MKIDNHVVELLRKKNKDFNYIEEEEEDKQMFDREQLSDVLISLLIWRSEKKANWFFSLGDVNQCWTIVQMSIEEKCEWERERRRYNESIIIIWW